MSAYPFLHEENSGLKITFYQQSMNETEKAYKENRTVSSRNLPETSALSGGSRVTIGQGNEGIPGIAVEKGKSLIELQQEAANTDVGITQDYMTIMSNTMTGEDYAKMQEEGFDFGSMEPEEAVTIVDKIKAELVRSGKNIAGYTDDLDVETLASALGSQVLAEAVIQNFAYADVPLTEENLELVSRAWNMAEQLHEPDEGSIRYLIDNELDSEIWNLYLAENSGASGSFAQASEGIPEGQIWEQIDQVIVQSGRNVNEESRQAAEWLFENELPVTIQNLDRLEELQKLKLPVAPEQFGRAVADALSEGKNPVYANLSERTENLYEKARLYNEYYHGDEIWSETAGNLTARRQLEEIRLRMTAEVNVKLLKSGFSIDTAPMEELLEALKQTESKLAQQYFPNDSMAMEKYRNFRRAENVISELPALPARVIGSFAERLNADSLIEFHREGTVLQDEYTKARQSYETLMTVPRKDLGDSIRKAFGNVDNILSDMGQEPTEENRRAVRILGYNRMEINSDNLEKVKEADRQVRTIVEKLTPAAVLKMIRDGVNPLEKTFPQLEEYFDSLPREYKEETESYSRYLYSLEQNHEITPEERESFIGIYRLLRQVEKSDGAVVGTLVNAQAGLNFANLLSAVRSGKFRFMDVKVGDELGTVSELIKKGESISEQIGKAFLTCAEKIVSEVSDREEIAGEYNREQLEQYRMAVTSADKDTVSMLQRGELPTGADYLLAAEALLEDTENLFNGRRDTKRGTELWKRLSEPEDFRREYEDNVSEAKSNLEENTVDEADTSLDVRRMQLAHKQLTIAATLTQSREFFLPVYIGDNLTRVHLVLEQNRDGGGMVDISINAGAGEGIRAAFRFENGMLEGIIQNQNRNEVMKTEKIADIFRKEAGESWNLGDIRIVSEDVRFPAIGKGTDAVTENAELYRVAKSFLSAVQQGEITDEN